VDLIPAEVAAGRGGLGAGFDGAGLADLPVGSVDDYLAAAVVGDDLQGPSDRLGLGGGSGTLGMVLP
jgi:hypothetical protein